MGVPHLPKPLILALAIRSLGLLLPQTQFQPDEYWQSLEPAHHYVFGYGHLTWEWRDLPDGGRMRGWIWPSVFVLVYKSLQRTGLDQTFMLVSRDCTTGTKDHQLTRTDTAASDSRSGGGCHDGLGDLSPIHKAHGSGLVSWSCKSTTISRAYASSSCRSQTPFTPMLYLGPCRTLPRRC
jgi:hypothetical protein